MRLAALTILRAAPIEVFSQRSFNPEPTATAVWSRRRWLRVKRPILRRERHRTTAAPQCRLGETESPGNEIARRGGKSLIELLVVMTCLSLLTLISFRAVHVIMRFQSASVRRLSWSLDASRFARDLRRDAHESRSAAVDAGAVESESSLNLKLSDSREIHYVLKKGSAERSVRHDGNVVAREMYSLPFGILRLGLTENSRLVRVSCRTGDFSRSDSDAVADRDAEILAAVGIAVGVSR